MNTITHGFYSENKHNIGSVKQPKDILQKTEEYLKRKTQFNNTIKDSGFKINNTNKTIFWSIASYFVRLKNYGITKQEKDTGYEGLNFLGQYISVFDVDIYG